MAPGSPCVKDPWAIMIRAQSNEKRIILREGWSFTPYSDAPAPISSRSCRRGPEISRLLEQPSERSCLEQEQLCAWRCSGSESKRDASHHCSHQHVISAYLHLAVRWGISLPSRPIPSSCPLLSPDRLGPRE